MSSSALNRLLVRDEQGWITADITTSGNALRAALEHPQADAVVRCCLLMALCALAEGNGWPEAALRCMGDFMERMSQELRTTQLI